MAQTETEKEDIVVFNGRNVDEKQPWFFDELTERLHSTGAKFFNTQLHNFSKDEYYDLLSRAKVVVSYALQENFGFGVNEAVYLGCVPVLPNRLVYPEFYTEEYLYNTFDESVNMVDDILDNSSLRKQNFGIKIYSLEKNKTLYSIRSDRLFTPASNIKLLTTALALKRLGPDYRFKTVLYGTIPVRARVLKGNLFIKGFGDPNLVSEQMWLLVNELKNLPLSKVNGDIVADNSFFDNAWSWHTINS